LEQSEDKYILSFPIPERNLDPYSKIIVNIPDNFKLIEISPEPTTKTPDQIIWDGTGEITLEKVVFSRF